MLFAFHFRRSCASAFRAASLVLLTLALVPVSSSTANAQSSAVHAKPLKPLLGFKATVGGRYDNIRMCIASSEGTPGGPAADIALIAAFPLDAGRRAELSITLPVFRPILFGAAFKMLQFEPELYFTYRVYSRQDFAFVIGSTLGFSFHYGPDYKSPRAADERTESFFAFGPMFGGFIGIDWGRYRTGLHPYMIPMTSISDAKNRTGVVIGGMLEASFRFDFPGR